MISKNTFVRWQMGFALIIVALGLLPAIPLAFIPVPITAQTLGVMLCGTVLGAKRGALAVLLFIALVALGLPLLAGGLGALLGHGLGLSVGGITLLAVLGASASYIAVPAAMRVALPQANATLSMAASLGITFPFNVLAGIPLYLLLAQWLHGS